MQMIQSFNQTIDYIETVLSDEIDEEKVARLSGYSYRMFSRLFSILTDTTLTEYIRSRRLTEAAMLLRDTGDKVIDIALRFGYESADAFTAAFKSFHGSTPSEVRSGRPFRLVSRIQLALSINGGRSMNITIQKKPALTVAGINRQAITSKLCPDTWGELFGKYSHQELAALGNGQSVGVCHDMAEMAPCEGQGGHLINYMAGYLVNDEKRAVELGLDILQTVEAEYAVVELQGKVPDCIHQGWKYVMEVFFPEHGYIHSGQPDFEYYLEGDMYSDDYRMELWIPVAREEK